MSLKHFHIAFVTICVLFCLGLGAWCLLLDGLSGMMRAMGWVSFVGAGALLFYGIRFYKKICRMDGGPIS